MGGLPVVAFASVATNLDGATGSFIQVYVRRRTWTRMVVSRPDGSVSTAGNGSSSNASISTNGAVVAFQSAASNLVAVDSNGNDDVFTRTRATSATLLAKAGGTATR